MELGNISIVNNSSIVFIDYINTYCNQWRNYSTYSHNFYMIYIILYFILSFIEKKFNPHIIWKYSFLEFNEFLITYIKNIVIGVLTFRIIIVYAIMQIYFNGG